MPFPDNSQTIVDTMNKNELNQALTLAKSTETLTNVDISIFNGFALPGFAPVNVTIPQVASLIRWQAIQLDGEIDAQAFDEIASQGRMRFNLYDYPR